MATEKQPKDLVELQIQVKSKILERIAENLRVQKGLVSGTQYTKSDGTNYGKYVKDDPAELGVLGDIWERVFSSASTPGGPPATPPPTGTGPAKSGG